MHALSGSKNHYIVPLTLIERIAALRHGHDVSMIRDPNICQSILSVHELQHAAHCKPRVPFPSVRDEDR